MYSSERCCQCEVHYVSLKRDYQGQIRQSYWRTGSERAKRKREKPTPFSITDILGLKPDENDDSQNRYFDGVKRQNYLDRLSDDAEYEKEENHENKTGHEDANNDKRKKTRTTFTGRQLYELEKRFEKSKYLSRLERQELADLLKISHNQVKTWYQNRRTKWKKEGKMETEIEISN